MTGYNNKVFVYCDVPFTFDGYILLQSPSAFQALLEGYNVEGNNEYFFYNEFIEDGGTVLFSVKRGSTETANNFKQRFLKYKKANFIIVKKETTSNEVLSTDCYNIVFCEFFEDLSKKEENKFTVKYTIEKNYYADFLFMPSDDSVLPSLSIRKGVLTTATRGAINYIKGFLSNFGLFETSPRVNGVGGVRRFNLEKNYVYPALYIDDENGNPNAFPNGAEFIAVCGGIMTDEIVNATESAIFTYKTVIKTPAEIEKALSAYCAAQKAILTNGTDGKQHEYDFKPEFAAIVPSAFLGLSAGQFLPTGSGIYAIKTAYGYWWADSYKVMNAASGENVVRILKNAYGLNRAFLQFYDSGRNFSEYQIEVGTPFNRVEIPRYEIFARDSTDYNLCELNVIFDGTARRFQMLLEVCGKVIDITEEFLVPLTITTDSERIAQQKIAQKVAIIQGVGSAALGGAAAAGGIATGNIAAAAGGAMSFVGAVGGVAQQLQNPVKPSVSSSGSGTGTTTIKYFGCGVYVSFVKFENAEEIKRDIETYGFNCNIQFDNMNAGVDLSGMGNNSQFMKIENAAFSSNYSLGKNTSDFLKLQFSKGVRIYYDIREMAEKEGI